MKKAIYQASYDNEIAICALAQKATEKKILELLCHRRKQIINQYAVKPDKARRRGKAGWVRGVDGRLNADRLLRLFLVLHGKSRLDQPLSAKALFDLHVTYQALYPGTKMHPNRIFYFFPQMRKQLITLTPECSDCGQPYVTFHDEQAQECAACTIKKEALIPANDDVTPTQSIHAAEA